jgi:hypothetical protein
VGVAVLCGIQSPRIQPPDSYWLSLVCTQPLLHISCLQVVLGKGGIYRGCPTSAASLVVVPSVARDLQFFRGLSKLQIPRRFAPRNGKSRKISSAGCRKAGPSTPLGFGRDDKPLVTAAAVKLAQRSELTYASLYRPSSCEVLCLIPMHRLIARLLLILLLAGIFAPVALAITAPAPHTCCMRKPVHEQGSHDSEFQGPPACCNHDCCRPLTVSQWADLGAGVTTCSSLPAAKLQSRTLPANVLSLMHHVLSVRGPPQFSIA